MEEEREQTDIEEEVEQYMNQAFNSEDEKKEYRKYVGKKLDDNKKPLNIKRWKEVKDVLLPTVEEEKWLEGKEIRSTTYLIHNSHDVEEEWIVIGAYTKDTSIKGAITQKYGKREIQSWSVDDLLDELEKYNARKIIPHIVESQVREICNECGADVSKQDGKYINRVVDLNSVQERVDMGKEYPKGDFVCRDCA